MTLAAKIAMCLALWNPHADLHSASEKLLSYWYRQEMNFIREGILDGDNTQFSVDKRHPYLPFDEFSQYFSLPNSAYIPIPDCIQSPSEEI